MALSEKLFLLKGYFDTLGTEIELLEKGRKASGARARKLALVMKKEFHLYRKEISETLKAMPVNKRTMIAKEVEEVIEVPAGEVPAGEVSVVPKKRGRKTKPEM